MARLLRDDAREQQHGHEVRDRHERVEHIRDGPDKVEREHRAEHDDSGEDHLVRQDRLAAEQIFRRPLAVVRPAEDGRVGEGDDADDEDRRADVRDLRERRRRHLAAVFDGVHVDVRVLHDGRDQNQTGHQADDDRIPERAGRGDERLTHRIARLRRRCDERCGAHAGFIGEQAARNTVLERETDAAADQTACDRARLERERQDCLDGREDVVGVDAEDNDAAEHIERRHERYELFADDRDGLDAADDDDRGDDAEDNADSDARERERQVVLHDLRDGVDLRAAADAERCEHREQREHHRHHSAERFPRQAALKRVHRAAHHAAVRRFYAVLDRDQAFCVLGRDAEHAGQPAPQHRARAAHEHRRAHADDVARADGGRERGRQSLKLADVAWGIRVLGHGQPDAGECLSLNKARAQGHEHVRAEQQHDHGQTPQPAVEGIDHLGEFLHFYTHPFVALRAAAEGKKGTRPYRPAPLRNNISIIPDSEPKIKSRP